MLRSIAALGGLLASVALCHGATSTISVVVQASSGPAAPAQAVAGGFPNLAFNADFSTGTHVSSAGPWYNPGIWYQNAGTGGLTPTSTGGVLNLPWAPGLSASGVTVGTMAPTGLANTSFQYGYMEASIAFPPVSGEWPAFWMQNLGATTSYHPTVTNHSYGEIDILEWQSQTPTAVYGTIHTAVAPAGQQVVDTQNSNGHNEATLPSGTNLANYNTYGLLWTPTQLSWYFNNRLMLTVTSTQYPIAFAIFNASPMYLMLTQQIGANWSFGNSPPSTPANMTVQWVHVWGK